MAHLQRHRLESVSDNSAPSTSSKSDSSDGSASEICEVIQEWSLDPESQSIPSQNSSGSSSSGSSHHHHHHHHHHHRHSQQQQQQQQQQLAAMNGNYINEDDTALDYDAKHDLISLDNGMITDFERAQVESFFSGLGTEVYVSTSLANLYESIGKDDWRLVYTGIPVLLHDKGCTRSRCTPRVSFVLAERGTCFALWKDTIDNLSDYKVAAAAFHTMCLSADHRKVIGFSFDSNQAAREMWVRVEELISNPENIALSAPGRKRKSKKVTKPIVLPPKSQISQPCQFHHVTSVTTGDVQRYFSLQAFVAPPVKHRMP
ncbi:uncharacterized protein LOC129727737 isoform X2 [Wyeomyia smithii]|nr:uncharacterized protein LOC129727737 isoform X2 [Wyeomyia smithii]XP_055541825.1 uncharacterized protein LOC129727737 isoform X2 [Wyeomyia smithii]XP_055541826.1 uncharacterized protein LOC129727737 isoform X2 [Wyeomyia smithii]XP_055541827.1 uncharacterized protein LOC129727737 isoform X2 [Wyeomyia smithii]XP_055541828.1 uncharacterized protein LOC129727737 isoform X2 [Wyeomyia smithii]